MKKCIQGSRALPEEWTQEIEMFGLHLLPKVVLLQSQCPTWQSLVTCDYFNFFSSLINSNIKIHFFGHTGHIPNAHQPHMTTVLDRQIYNMSIITESLQDRTILNNSPKAIWQTQDSYMMLWFFARYKDLPKKTYP